MTQTTDALSILLRETDDDEGMVSDPPEICELVRDLELFDGETGVFSKMSAEHVRLRAGEATHRILRWMLVRPTDDFAVLNRRQKWLLDREALLGKTPPADVLAAEEDMLWAWRFLTNPDEDVKELHQSAYFSHWLIGNWLNASPAMLAGSNLYRIFAAPVIGVLTPVAYILVPYFVVRFKFKIPISFVDFLKMMYTLVMSQTRQKLGFRRQVTRFASIGVSLVFYFQNVFSSVQVAKMLHGVCYGVSQRVAAIRRFSAHTLESWSALGGDVAWTEAAQCWPAPQLAWCQPSVSGEERTLASPGQGATTTGGCLQCCASMLSRYGGELAFFRTVVKSGAISSILRRAYIMDALGTIVRMRNALSLSATRFVGLVSPPLVHLEGVWHPGVDATIAVANDWRLGDDNGAGGSTRNVLLTGPNAGGKSTLMKGVLMAVLMAQTFTFAPCRKGMTLRPFGRICSHINVPDSYSRGESLFQAEMNRAKQCVRALEDARRDGRTCLVVIDEIFSSTNPVEGISGAYATARKLGSFDNAINIVSTHYAYLARLTSSPSSGAVAPFSAFKMPVNLARGGRLEAEYKLKRGVSEQYVALEIMRASGMNDDIVNDAIKIKKALLRPPPNVKKIIKESSKDNDLEVPDNDQDDHGIGNAQQEVLPPRSSATTS